MTVRNEAGYIETTLRSLISDGVEVILIDHGSIDGTRELAEQFLGGGLLRILDVPWRGVYDLTRLLAQQREVYRTSRHDWHLRIDADEWPRATVNATLAEFLEYQVAERHWVVNFDEFVFLPPLGVDMWGMDYRRLATDYYHFEPQPMRLMRAWRRGTVDDFVSGAGHRFVGLACERVHPQNQVLRHYIGLSWSHAIDKRASRRYGESDLSKGWHCNRLRMDSAWPVTDSPILRRAEPWHVRCLDRSVPSRSHFWEQEFPRLRRAVGT
jgi:hypothetical protein